MRGLAIRPACGSHAENGGYPFIFGRKGRNSTLNTLIARADALPPKVGARKATGKDATVYFGW